jgi:oxygen-independent coproporphyrinogen-3 oxidase
MSAIPEQTIQSYEDSLRRVIMLNPEHISSYSLIIEEGTPFYEIYSDKPPVDEETDRIMYWQTEEILSAAGYERYEISNYAKPGKECRHNLKYWKRERYIGMGLSAASCLDHKRFRNEASMEAYRQKIQEHVLPICETEELTKEDEMAEFMYLGLRCMKGISVKQFENTFEQDFSALYGKTVENLVSQGLLKREKDNIRLTHRGIDVSNRVFAEFI